MITQFALKFGSVEDVPNVKFRLGSLSADHISLADYTMFALLAYSPRRATGRCL